MADQMKKKRTKREFISQLSYEISFSAFTVSLIAAWLARQSFIRNKAKVKSIFTNRRENKLEMEPLKSVYL